MFPQLLAGLMRLVAPPAAQSVRPSGPQSSQQNPLEALRTSVLQTRQQGVSDVNVTNPVRPNVPQSFSIVVNATTNADPQAIGNAVRGELGPAVQAAVESAYSDGAV